MSTCFTQRKLSYLCFACSTREMSCVRPAIKDWIEIVGDRPLAALEGQSQIR
uniref:Uncharacterized protein n=1 Tax=Picea glauca TaxID=3330 RepID=A0A101M4G4_PICGL|nr:hypothetical protein ABT39_MTgene499 [Picea glauca]